MANGAHTSLLHVPLLRAYPLTRYPVTIDQYGFYNTKLADYVTGRGLYKEKFLRDLPTQPVTEIRSSTTPHEVSHDFSELEGVDAWYLHSEIYSMRSYMHSISPGQWPRQA